MKKIVIILIVLLPVSLLAQYTAFDNVLVVSKDGNAIHIQQSDIPVSPENPDPDPPTPELEWEDSVDFDCLYFEDFQDFPITATLADVFPNGIHDDTVAAHLLNFTAVASDDTELGHGDPNYASNLDIVMRNGIKMVQSWYLINRCCTGAAADEYLDDSSTSGYDSNYIPGGTGGQLEARITSPTTWTKRVIAHQWIEFPSDTSQFGEFENSDGFKTPALKIDRKDGDRYYGSSRLMVLDYSAGTTLDPAYYNSAWWDSWTDTYTKSNTKTKTPDIWFTPGMHLVSRVMDAGTEQDSNGWNHLYIDGKLIDDGAGGGILNSIPFLTLDDPVGWSYIEWSVFMGGSSYDYMSPKTQVLWFGPFGVEIQDDYDTTPVAGQDIYIPKYMKECGLTWEE